VLDSAIFFFQGFAVLLLSPSSTPASTACWGLRLALLAPS
jgi:hypothetical protein